MVAFHATCVVLLLTFSLASAANEIKDLPGLKSDVKFKHYSGYLKASKTRHLHYWREIVLSFIKAHTNQDWEDLNRAEYNAASKWTLLPNRTQFCARTEYGAVLDLLLYRAPFCTSTTSAENYEAIKQFFVVHPEFRESAVFISGESYAGIYVPTLAARVIDGQKDFPLNFTGIIIGNGLVDIPLTFTTQAAWLYTHGFVDESAWSDLRKCCKGDVDGCDYNSLEYDCQDQFSQAFDVPGKLSRQGHMTVYDVYRNCTIDPSASYLFPVQASEIRSGSVDTAPPKSLPSCEPYYGGYLNRKDVRKALNIPDHVDEWKECNDNIHMAYGPMQVWPSTMRPQVKKALASGVRALLYYGDTDAVCNSLLGQKFAASLGLKQKTPKTPWMYGAELGGFKTVYEGGLTYVTVRGVGHMVPQWKNAESQQVIRRFLADKEI